ncbi:hypothetical protein NKL07_22085 [Mesorhizobium sp. C280B]|uniref:hypothetical protein n=1 Tax=unclassified Mesorhizobium TaxID=325217 RepID=UPI0003CE919C|nr:hypothetical protein [Mesorhizobium sp. LSJC280B00]ESW92961.1 hypothetical protein X772_03185 [Mesorhizobium sp. LSJC280B00]
METFYATFGTGWGYAGGYVEIIAENRHAATAHMVKEHGERWAAIYTATEFVQTLKRYALHKLATVRQRPGPGEAFFDIVRGDRHG